MAAKKGSYILVLDLAEDATLKIGRLGTFEFPAGLYLYCGSALNGLEARIRRHLRRHKKRHWHIDYLTAVAPVVQVWWVEDDERWECRWTEAIAAQGGKVTARGFGSSDCRCPTHLLRKGRGTEVDVLAQMLFDFGGNREHGVWTSGGDEDSPGFIPGESK